MLTRKLGDRGIELRSLTKGIDTATINGKFAFRLFAALAGFERARGRKGGKPKLLRPEKRRHEALARTVAAPRRAARARSSARSALSRRRTRRSTTSTSRRTRRRPICGSGATWLANLPEGGICEMCAWERFCTFAREPEHRAVGADARVSVAGTLYEVDADLAGETVLLWWGLFDQDLYVAHGDARFDPYHPVGGPVRLHHYRQHKKGKREKRADRVAALAGALQVPRAVLEGHPALGSATGGAGAAAVPSGCRWPGWRRRSAPSSTPCWPRPLSAAPC